MKIIIEKLLEGEEEQMIVKSNNISPELLGIINTLKAQDNLLIAYRGNEIHRVNPADVYYVDTVDNKAFLYCQKHIYESKLKLYEIEALNIPDFTRISRSGIINLSKVKALVPAMSGRLEAILHNDERVIISRKYVTDLKHDLGM